MTEGEDTVDEGRRALFQEINRTIVQAVDKEMVFFPDSLKRITRRQFLAFAGMGVGAAAIGAIGADEIAKLRRTNDTTVTGFTSHAGGGSDVHTHDIPDQGPVTIHGITFQNVLNAVDDLGMDPDGQNPVDQTFRDATAEDTLIVFPPGNYLWEEEHDVENISNFGIISSTCDPADVTFEFPQGFRETLAIRDGSVNVLVEGFEIAQTPDRDTGIGVVVRADDKAEIHHLSFTGFSPSYEPSNQLYATIETTDGVGNISNIKIDGGGVEDTYPNRMVGIFGGTPHVGELRIRNCDIRELGSSGIRYTGGTGAVKVEDCYFENIDNAALRIHGNDHPNKKSWVKRCEFVNDDSLVEHLPDGENYENADMIRADGAGNAYSGLLIEDCTFEHRSNPGDGGFSRGCVTRVGWGNHGSITVRGCTMRIDADGPEAVDAGASSDAAPNAVTVENTHVTGDLSETNSGALIHIGGSPDSVVRDCCIDTPNVQNGVRVENSDSCTVENSAIAVSGEQVVSQNSTVETSGLSSTADCRQPEDPTNKRDPTTDSDPSEPSGVTAACLKYFRSG